MDSLPLYHRFDQLVNHKNVAEKVAAILLALMKTKIIFAVEKLRAWLFHKKYQQKYCH